MFVRFFYFANLVFNYNRIFLTKKFSSSLLLIIWFLASSYIVNAQPPAPSPVFARNYRVTGTAMIYNAEAGGFIPLPFAPVLIKIKAGQTNFSNIYTVETRYTVLSSDAEGKFETTLPCYNDANNQYSPTYEIGAVIVGSTTGAVGGGGAYNCESPGNQFLGVDPRTGPNNFLSIDLQNCGSDDCLKGMIVQALKSVGKPVNSSTGNMWISQNDYSLSGVGENINVTRFYNSSIQEGGMFGWSWKSDYEESIAQFPNNGGFNYIALRMGSGKATYLVSENNINYQSATSGFYGQVTKNPDGSFTYISQDGRTTQFLPNGKLLWKRDRNGNQTTLSYNANNQLIGVTDAFGRTLNFVPNPNGTIAQISDNLGVVANYVYNPNSTLQSVNYPDGSKYQFEYVVINGKTYLTTVRDALNNILETHQYDAQGRAITSEKQGGVEKYTLDYTHLNDLTNPYTIVTDALGRTSKYTFDKSKGVNVVTQIEGNCNCGSGSQVTNYLYDQNLNIVKKVDALNRETNYTFDSKGNALTMIDPTGIETFTYNKFG